MPTDDPELLSIGRVRSLATWLRKSSKTAEQYPRIGKLSSSEVADAKAFACGIYPWPHRWTKRLFNYAKSG